MNSESIDSFFCNLMHFKLNNQFSSHLDPKNCRLTEIISLLYQQRGSFGEKQAHSVVCNLVQQQQIGVLLQKQKYCKRLHPPSFKFKVNFSCENSFLGGAILIDVY